MPPLETRDHDPLWGRMFKSSAELEAAKDEAIARAREAYDATTRAIASGLQHLAGPRDAPVNKLKVGMQPEMRKANALGRRCRCRGTSAWDGSHSERMTPLSSTLLRAAERRETSGSRATAH
ncbi:hypothetical protein ACO2Q0_03105 [Phenylobacterium sp. VNQ135]|uniref:hypothetical protein n=1 Tax=Phenylobacterium sp. VNQ135 TaxID=3400922 RepID=UPI003C0D95E8